MFAWHQSLPGFSDTSDGVSTRQQCSRAESQTVKSSHGRDTNFCGVPSVSDLCDEDGIDDSQEILRDPHASEFAELEAMMTRHFAIQGAAPLASTETCDDTLYRPGGSQVVTGTLAIEEERSNWIALDEVKWEASLPMTQKLPSRGSIGFSDGFELDDTDVGDDKPNLQMMLPQAKLPKAGPSARENSRVSARVDSRSSAQKELDTRPAVAQAPDSFDPGDLNAAMGEEIPDCQASVSVMPGRMVGLLDCPSLLAPTFSSVSLSAMLIASRQWWVPSRLNLVSSSEPQHFEPSLPKSELSEASDAFKEAAAFDTQERSGSRWSDVSLSSTPSLAQPQKHWRTTRAKVDALIVMGGILDGVRGRQTQQLYDEDWVAASKKSPLCLGQASICGEPVESVGGNGDALRRLTDEPGKATQAAVAGNATLSGCKRSHWNSVRRKMDAMHVMGSLLDDVRAHETENLYDMPWRVQGATSGHQLPEDNDALPSLLQPKRAPRENLDKV